jgi:hypothetical protein
MYNETVTRGMINLDIQYTRSAHQYLNSCTNNKGGKQEEVLVRSHIYKVEEVKPSKPPEKIWVIEARSGLVGTGRVVQKRVPIHCSNLQRTDSSRGVLGNSAVRSPIIGRNCPQLFQNGPQIYSPWV